MIMRGRDLLSNGGRRIKLLVFYVFNFKRQCKNGRVRMKLNGGGKVTLFCLYQQRTEKHHQEGWEPF